MKKKLLIVACVISALVLIVCACSGESATEEEEDDEDEESVAATEGSESADGTTAPNNDPEPTVPDQTQPDNTTPVVDGIPGAPNANASDKLEKLYTSAEGTYISGRDCGGLIYRDSETKKEGILSLDGLKDSGAIYYKVDTVGGYFSVTLEKPEDPQNIDSLNKTGLVDGNGKVLIPAEYALIDEIDSVGRFFKVIKATEQTTSKDEMLLYLTSKMFSLSASDEDVLYKGVWYVYDVVAGKCVNGVSGTKPYSVNAFGDAITYTSDDGTSMKVNARGEAFPAEAKLVGGGYYYLDATYSIYSALGEKMFEYKDGGSITYDETSGYFIVGKYANGSNEYKVLDMTGAVVASGMSKRPYVYSQDMMIYDGTLCDFAGNPMLADKVDTVLKYGPFWYVRNYTEKKFYLFNENRELLFTGAESENESFLSVNWLVEKETDQGKRYYCFATGTFEYDGRSVGAGMVSVEKDDGTYDLVNTHTGEVMVSGFKQYTVDIAEDGTIYIFAIASPCTTVYKVK